MLEHRLHGVSSETVNRPDLSPRPRPSARRSAPRRPEPCPRGGWTASSLRIGIDADDGVAARGEAGCRHTPDVSQAEDTQRHLARLLTTCSPPLTGRENGPLVTAPDMTAVDRQSRIRRRALTTSTISRSRRPSRSLRFRYRPRVDSAQQGNARRPVRRDLGTLRPTSQDGDPGLEAVGPPPEVGLDVAP